MPRARHKSTPRRCSCLWRAKTLPFGPEKLTGKASDGMRQFTSDSSADSLKQEASRRRWQP